MDKSCSLRVQSQHCRDWRHTYAHGPTHPLPYAPHTHAHAPTHGCTHACTHSCSPHTLLIPLHMHTPTHRCTHLFQNKLPQFVQAVDLTSASPTWGHPLLSSPLREGLSGCSLKSPVLLPSPALPSCSQVATGQ